MGHLGCDHFGNVGESFGGVSESVADYYEAGLVGFYFGRDCDGRSGASEGGHFGCV